MQKFKQSQNLQDWVLCYSLAGTCIAHFCFDLTNNFLLFPFIYRKGRREEQCMVSPDSVPLLNVTCGDFGSFKRINGGIGIYSSSSGNNSFGGQEIFNEYLNICWTFQTCINGAPNSLRHQDHVVQYCGSTCG